MSTEHKKLGKYDLLDVIGRGGMGVIYKGVDPEIGRLVAVKMMTRGFAEDPELLQRFYREAQSAGQLQHPNIVTIHDLGVHDGNPYLVMEFLEGESLENAIRARRAILLEDKLNTVMQICDGLGYAHKRQIIHRDVKPANVMLLKDGGVKIVDFGIARVGNQSLTRPGAIMGSIQYMSPEQLNGASVDARSDIFSLGVLLYQLLTSNLPFEGKDTGDTILKIIHQPAPPLSQYISDYPAELDEIVQRALAKDPEQRYQATEDLGFDLGHVREQLRRERSSEYMHEAESALRQGQFSRAKEQLLQVLKLDRQNPRANALLREVQQEIQKQQRSEQAQGLRAEAERALARKELGDALAYLEQALKLDDTNADIAQLCATVREKKERAEKVRDLAQRAEMAQDAGDLDEARRAIEEALAVDETSTEVRSLHAAICREMAERDRQLHLQQFMGEARKHISSRRFTEALQVLKEAQSVDPALPGIQELIDLAENGQQQETRRKELERINSVIEGALNREDYQTACAVADEGLRKYPGERGLTKLKAVAEKQREASERRKYVEGVISANRKLLEQQKTEEALRSLQDALEKYPTEFALQSMHALVSETLERDRAEQKKSAVLQKAREAIYRKSYDEAITMLEAARVETPSSEFDDLLQFAHDEAANYEKRQAIDAVMEQAQRLNSEEKYEEAIHLLEGTLEKYPDEELEIILSDNRRHVAEFNAKVQEAITTAGRLLRQDRYAEAVKLLESKSAQFGKSPAFAAILEEARAKQQLVLALSALKEEVRDALARSEPDRAQHIVDKHRDQLGEHSDFRLLQREIAVKRTEIANRSLEMATRDARVLLVVRSFDSAVRVLRSVAAQAPSADPELRERFETLLNAAEAGFAKQQGEEQEEKARRVAALHPGAAGDETELGTPDTLDLADGTQVAEPMRLQDILGEVTQIADHYRDDSRIQSAIDHLKEKITLRMSAVHEAEPVEQRDDPAKQTETAPFDATIRADEGTPWPSADIEAVASDATILATPETLIPEEPVGAAESPITAGDSGPALADQGTVLASGDAIPFPAEMAGAAGELIAEPPTLESAAVPQAAESEVAEQPRVTPTVPDEEAVTEEAIAEPALATPASAEPESESGIEAEAIAEPLTAAGTAEPAITEPGIEQQAEPAAVETAIATPVEEPARVQQPIVAQPPVAPPSIAPPPVAPPAPAEQAPVAPTPPPPRLDRPQVKIPPTVPPPRRVSRPPEPQAPLWKKPSVLVGVAATVVLVIGIAFYAKKPHVSAPVQPPVTTPAPPPVTAPVQRPVTTLAQPEKNPIEAQQQAALHEADKLQATGDLGGAHRKLEQVASLNGPLSAKIQARLAEIGSAMQEQRPRQLRRKEEPDLKTSRRQKKSAPRCGALRERLQLGEVLNEEDRTFLKESCE